jgi:uncharacterized membrane protein YhhN
MDHIVSIKYFIPLFVCFAAVFLLREFFTFRRVLKLKYLLTPLITTSIMPFVLLSVSIYGAGRYPILIIMGLAVSLAADTLLMVEEVNFFKHGLLFFMIAHFFYIAAFSIDYVFSPWHVSMVVFCVIAVALFYGSIVKKSGKQNPWVLVYMVALCAMWFLAFSYISPFRGGRGILLPAGATLFVISDTMLAVNAFLKPIPHSTVLTWSLYAPAQFFIALSCFY